MGTLSASISSAEKATLSYEGKRVKSLKAGTYTVTLENHSARVGLILGEVSEHAVALSTRAAVGKSSHRVTLSSGSWFFEVTTHGPKTYFSVVA